MNQPDTIRQAIARGDYPAAREAWQRYTATLETELRSGVLPAAWSEFESLYRWCREVLLCARAHATDRLNALHAAGAYAPVPAARPPILRKDL
ncbi:MAG: hypothetical protein KGN36_06800 [Acidobacteriota bacterium]|nr:hypothetical protein [Acidobacteriota bacterium]